MSSITRSTFAITRHKTAALLLVVLFVLAALAGSSLRPARAGSGQTTTVIVELKGEPASVYSARTRQQQGRNVSTEELQNYRGQLSAEQDKFLASLAARGVTATLASRGVKNYNGSLAANVPLRYTLVYNGLVLKVPASSVAALRAMPEVKSVRPDAQLHTQLAHSVPYINAPKVYGAVEELSQFDDLREGYEGQGMYLAVIDTGIDWTHPMFGGDPTPPRLGVAPVSASVQTNKKVVYYLPLTDIAVEDGFGHGTHVASTAAGYLALHPGPDGLPNTADDIRLHGVAPQAKLMAYKVCSDIKSTVSQVQPVGGCDSSNTIMALEDAMSPFTLTGQAKPVAHVINLSLGGSGGPDDPTAVACSNAALAGATVVAASGNSGPDDGTTGSPAAGRHVISVGATTHPGGGSNWSIDMLQASAVAPTRTGAVTPANNFATAPGNERIVLYPMSGSTGLPASAIAQHYVYVNDPLVAWPASVSGRIALVKSTLDGVFASTAAQAANAGAVGVIVFDDRGTVNGVRTTIPAAAVTVADGERLIDALSSTDDNNVDPPNGAISELPIRMNPFFSEKFIGEMAGFSSRGPVEGFGQIKPDVSAPGVHVLAAAPPASVVGALGALEGTPNYAHLDGTSMATPHTAGAALLVRQAHLDWTADMVRTAFINTATNLRDERGAPKADGVTTADSIIAQGGGLIDVYEAVNAKALMGVKGDGIIEPSILGSHSYGEVPVINTRTTHTESVPVTIRDVSGQGGTYNLAVANNRDLQLAGLGVSVSQPSVTVPPNGEATFNVSATVDGDLLRDVMAAKTNGSQVLFERLQLQWFITAKRSDGGESLRMPFYFRPAMSIPANPDVKTLVQIGTVPAADTGVQLVGGVTYVDVPFDVDASTYQVDAKTEWLVAPAGGVPDLDYQLLDPEGNIIASSGAAGGPEFVSVRVTRPGTYTHRVVGYANAATDFTITTNLTKGPVPPSLGAIAGEFVDAEGRQVDFDGAFTLSWQPEGHERGFEVERSSDGGQTWDVIAAPSSGASSIALNAQPDGQLRYRVRGLHEGRIGLYVTPAGAEQSVLVDRRTLVDITSSVQTAMSNVTFTNGVFQLDLNINNATANTYLPRVELKVLRVNSTSGTVAVSNADNGGAGSAASPALFDYSNKLGADELFAGGETTAARTLRFSDPRGELFTYDIQVTAFQSASGGGAGSAASAASGGTQAGGTSSPSPLSALAPASVLRFTANPLTKAVSVQLVKALK
jgi:hypothetical protein